MKHYILIPPGGFSERGSLPLFVKIRLNYAFQYFQVKHPKKIICCGKWPLALQHVPDTTESDIQAAYLLRLGISRSTILKESDSQDLIGCAYYIKTRILIPHNVTAVHIITNDIFRQRTEYIFQKVLGPHYMISLVGLPTRLAAHPLWDFFINEEEITQMTRSFLKPMKRGDHQYLSTRLYRSTFFKRNPVSYSESLVFDTKIIKSAKPTPHYSLNNIQRKKASIFRRYGMTERKTHTFHTDFWSGRFLTFRAKDAEGNYYALKFVLNVNDRETFRTEMKLTSYLMRKHVVFVPEVVDSQITHAPLWYMYKIVDGKTAGTFSRDLSFGQHFYTPWVIRHIVGNLNCLRTATPKTHDLPQWSSAKLNKKLQSSIIPNADNTIFKSKDVQRAIQLLSANLSVFDSFSPYLSHNDLHPSNIILNISEKKTWFIDFEHAGLNSIAFDFCFLYVFSWDNPGFQTLLKQTYLASLNKNERHEFLILFPYTYAFFLLWLLNYVERWKKRLPKERRLLARSYILKELSVFNRQASIDIQPPKE